MGVTEGISENNSVSLESPVMHILWMLSFNLTSEFPQYQKTQTALNFSGISISCLCAMHEQLQGPMLQFS